MLMNSIEGIIKYYRNETIITEHVSTNFVSGIIVMATTVSQTELACVLSSLILTDDGVEVTVYFAEPRVVEFIVLFDV